MKTATVTLSQDLIVPPAGAIPSGYRYTFKKSGMADIVVSYGGTTLNQANFGPGDYTVEAAMVDQSGNPMHPVLTGSFSVPPDPIPMPVSMTISLS